MRIGISYENYNFNSQNKVYEICLRIFYQLCEVRFHCIQLLSIYESIISYAQYIAVPIILFLYKYRHITIRPYVLMYHINRRNGIIYLYYDLYRERLISKMIKMQLFLLLNRFYTPVFMAQCLTALLKNLFYWEKIFHQNLTTFFIVTMLFFTV